MSILLYASNTPVVSYGNINIISQATLPLSLTKQRAHGPDVPEFLMREFLMRGTMAWWAGANRRHCENLEKVALRVSPDNRMLNCFVGPSGRQ
jgi:hypothetical protein